MIDRKLLSECVVLLSVCIGAWLMIVRPKFNQLTELETMIAEAKSDPARDSRQTVEQMAAKLHELRREVKDIVRQNELGEDSSRMYGLITDLASEHRVVIGGLNPGAQAESGDVAKTPFTMSVSGKYRQVAAFLDGILQIDGFVRPGSLTLSPDGAAGNAMVTAQFSCETLSFEVPSALVAIVGVEDADE